MSHFSLQATRKVSDGKFGHTELQVMVYGIPVKATDQEISEAIDASVNRGAPALLAALEAKLTSYLSLQAQPQPEPTRPRVVDWDETEASAPEPPQREPSPQPVAAASVSEPQPIPSAADVDLTPIQLHAFGVPVAEPRKEEFGQPATEAQVRMVNTLLTKLGYKAKARHAPVLALCQELLRGTPIESFSRTVLASMKDLTRGEAMMAIDWMDKVLLENLEDARDQLQAAAQGVTAEPLGESSPSLEVIVGGVAGSAPTATETVASPAAVSAQVGPTSEDADEDWQVVPTTAKMPVVLPAAVQVREPLPVLGFDPYMDFQFTDEQEDAAMIMLQAAEDCGRTVFFTGKAGTGKSTVARRVRMSQIGEEGRTVRMPILAPTGKAALNVGGMTIHRFCGIKPGMSRAQVRSVPERYESVLRHADAVLIDEISMVRADLLDMVDWAFRKTLGVDAPFGGKTIIAVGDMFQLPPVVLESEAKMFGPEGEYPSPFWFHAKVFGGKNGLFRADSYPIMRVGLSQVHRQKGGEFVEALNRLRIGDGAAAAIINRLCPVTSPGDDVTRLCFTKKAAAEINERALAALPGEGTEFEAQLTGEWDLTKEANIPAPHKVRLKVGSRVMVTANVRDAYERQLVNGDVGTVRSLGASTVVVEIERRNERFTVELGRNIWGRTSYQTKGDEVEEVTEATYRQIPLIPAWAITVHKAQGATLERAHLEMDGVNRQPGQTYVGLSRVTSAEGLTLGRALTPGDFSVSPVVRAFECGYYGGGK